MKKKSILFVDDDEHVGSLMTVLLQRAGYFVVVASNGPDALGILRQRRFNLIITDYQMPGMSGLEFLSVVRREEISNAPALMMSGVTETDVRRDCYKVGVYDFISKPEDPVIILKRVENGLAISELLLYRARMQTELMGAKKLHENLFPERDEPAAQTIHTRSFALPLMEIGGDSWDSFGDEDHLWFYLADVTGHGISAALFTSVLKLEFRRAAETMKTPAEVVSEVNREMSGFLADQVYVSAFCGRFDLRENSLSYTNAGHPPALARIGGRFRLLRSSGMWIGVDARFEYMQRKVPFGPGDWFHMCTDGILEGSSMRDGRTGKRFVYDTIRSDPATMQKGFADIQAWVEDDMVQQDDCTQLLIWRDDAVHAHQ